MKNQKSYLYLVLRGEEPCFLLSITILVLPPFTMLSLGNKFLVFILMSNVASKEALLLFDGNDQSKTKNALAGIQNDFRVLVGLELCFFIAY